MEDAHKPIELELVDLGCATKETKQCTPMFFIADSWFQWGSYQEPQGGWPNCPP